jgi:uncharacterized SAM-binding protein YcdF (DUF218 family)
LPIERGRNDPPKLLVLLGAPLCADASPGPALRRRLDCALGLLLAEPRARILITGGVPPHAPCARSEAAAAADALRAAGIASERMLLECRARNTWENAVHTARLLHAHAWSGPPLYLVTDPWHLPRAKLAFRAQGLVVRSAGCPQGAAARPRRGLARLLLREMLGLCVYLLRWLRVSLRGRPHPPGA